MPRSLPGLWLIALFTAVCPAWGQVEERAVRVDTGDILEVMVPRYPELSKPYPVSPTGGITLDLVGEVAVRGLTAPEIEALLERRLAEYLRYPQGVVVRVAARRMLVRVLGQVAEPGLKEVPKEANVQEILAAAGGPQLGAVVTRIVLRRRHGDWIEEIPVDLKAYLEGRAELPQVLHNDEIFVPRVGTEGGVMRPLTPQEVVDEPTAGKAQVIGAVRQPGPVSVPADGSLLQVLAAAGGWAETADLAHVRRVPGGRGEAENIDLQSYLERGGVVPRISAGDVITVPTRAAAARTVRVLGAVATPGPVQLPIDADVQTALAAAGGPLPSGDTRRITLIRREGSELNRRQLNLEDYLTSGDSALMPDLREGDVLFVPKGSVPLQAPTATVYILGQVAKPGPYPLVEQRPLLHLLAQAGGASPTANLRRLRITRADPTAEPRAIEFDLLAYQQGRGELPTLFDGDTVTVDPNLVTVVGDVVKAGPVELATRATVVDAIAAAGGPNLTADLSRIVLTRPGPDGPQRQVIDLEQYLYQPEQAPPLPEVQAGDVVAVEAGTAEEQVAYVLGAVQRPGAVPIPGKRASVLYALAQAGGVLPTADQQQVRILRPNATGVTTETFDYKSLVGGLAATAPPEVHPGDIVAVDDLSRPGRGVLVLGAVARQGRVPVEGDNQTVIDTIGLAGGLTPDANPSRARLVRADGEVINLDLAQFSKTGAAMPVVRDGDVLVVAHRRQTPTLWDEIMRYLPLLGLVLR